MSARSRSIHARMRKLLPSGIRGLESRPRNTRGDITANWTPPLARFSLASILKKLMLRRNVQQSISVVFRVGNFETSLLAAKSKGLLPDSTEKDPDQGQFAHFHDPDGNEVTIWGGKI